MTLPVQTNRLELIDNFEDFFAPTSKGTISNLFEEYKADKKQIEEVASYMASVPNMDCMSFFSIGNNRNADRSSVSIRELFGLSGAMSALDAHYWDKTLKLTDVLDLMPSNKREDWTDQVSKLKCPKFNETTVLATVSELLSSRKQFFAERVDNIFRKLSKEHVTNSPEGFNKRMIIWPNGNAYRTSILHDLRCIIAKFMGRSDPSYQSSDIALRHAGEACGDWIRVDGGTLKLRTYKKGTIHLEVHPDMAWRLNSVLASLYPLAIPSQFRTKPQKKQKDIELIQRPIPEKILLAMEKLKPGKDYIETKYGETFRDIKNTLTLVYSDIKDKFIVAEVESLLCAIGGVENAKKYYYEFDYDPSFVLQEIIASGMLPDKKSHQFYPTPKELAQYVIELADILPEHSVLEPSAGLGSLADQVVSKNLLCVEVANLHCSVLRSKGYKVVHDDFLEWSSKTTETFDRAVMNPPFSDGRAISHVMAASKLVKSGGRLVSILPSGAKGKITIDGWNVSWSEILENQFSGTSISVVILIADRL